MLITLTFIILFFHAVGSRDSNLALWKIVDDEWDCDTKVSNFITGQASTLPSFDYKIEEPAQIKYCAGAEKIRALAYNEQAMVLIFQLYIHYHLFGISNL